MTKKNIRPQQVAPVERETISTAKDQSGQVTAQLQSFCGRRRGVSHPILPLTSKNIKSLFLHPLAHGSPG
ncbi:anacyclamide/piricyclamide family prenylated cyclic peptide [Cuspidothrix issatschenkoi LEGE 03284]|uniref:anacyclamide/piricyclamide family prenylated cyclic peptide n=1 Tax=Cuspidothrix issatschenkoi TaxID=230752 RepID=UPI001882C4C3|nr:anacyclamide/piricyclamide family prenylated cyclic peptide [Cuspidothrix issatschenkoi]MBE9232142.1 anacyclamide/piricyclamide family prenylated cyclic peptide [Cuspidothrix issatschenkoi LEGE 03284]